MLKLKVMKFSIGDIVRLRPDYFPNFPNYMAEVKIIGLGPGKRVQLDGMAGLDIRTSDLIPQFKYAGTAGQSGTEEQLQNACALYLDSKKIIYYHCPNGGNRDAVTGAKLKRAGVKRGVPDLIISGKMLVVELKVGNNKPTAEQLWWLAHFRSIGWRAFWVNSLDEFLTLMSE